MKLISLDFDGVIADSPSFKREVAIAMLGREVSLAELSGDRIKAGESTLSLEEYREVQRRTYAPETMPRVKPLEGSLEAMRTWLDEGHDVRIVTAREGDILESAREWLRERGFSIPMAGVGHKASKLSHLQGSDYFVDDDIDHVRAALATVPGARLFRWSFNAHAADLPSIASLQELLTQA